MHPRLRPNCPVKSTLEVTANRLCYRNKLARLLPDPTCVTVPSIAISCIVCSSLW